MKIQIHKYKIIHTETRTHKKISENLTIIKIKKTHDEYFLQISVASCTDEL